MYWDRETTSSTGAMATANPNNIDMGDSLVEDLFKEKFMGIATGGSHGEKILRGFLIGVAIGLVVACFTCCWYPCCGGARNRRRNELIRRRMLAARQLDEENGAGAQNQTETRGTQTQSETQQTSAPDRNSA